ncbi:hypothetical protein GGQ92_003292 [Gracilibacillus halotolerans]|uniref:DUF2975 domain-containing protein n=1 Tax=Gracilibacillus halotolerans TaxID=74386 RepID=A0A841RNL7_9BACI|nr:DUF2975 domain-containing protein [Gracilibacillus halotolerans]MBB6514441.1 hypothetical protein [Gracilibacillus halotolerans]
MKQVSTLFLKIIVIIMGIPVLALCILALPRIVGEAIEHAVNGDTLGYIVLSILLIMYISAIPFYLGLYQTLKLLSYIEKDQAFSSISVIALKKIKNSAKLISVLYGVALPLVYVIAEWDDAPGLILIGVIIIGASLAVAVFSSVLQRLLQKAIEIKAENDLTV